MNLWDIVLAVVLAAIIVGAGILHLRRRKRGGCGCGCDGCARPCDRRDDDSSLLR